MTQLTFTDAPAQRHSETSKAAAESIAPQAGTLRYAVLRLLKAYPEGLTDHEIQDLTGLNPSTERPRRIELWRAGLVADSGKTRVTPSGRRAVIWVAT